MLFVAQSPNGFIADEGDAGEDGPLPTSPDCGRSLVGYDEVAALVRHATAEQRGVGGIHHGHVRISHWLPLLVDDGACEVAVGLVRALHIEFVFSTIDNPDWIESDDLHDGFRQ